MSCRHQPAMDLSDTAIRLCRMLDETTELQAVIRINIAISRKTSDRPDG